MELEGVVHNGVIVADNATQRQPRKRACESPRFRSNSQDLSANGLGLSKSL